MASRDKVDVDTFQKGIQYALERLGNSKFGFESTTVSSFENKRHEGSGNELVDYSRAPCLGADQKARGLWERDCNVTANTPPPLANSCSGSRFDPEPCNQVPFTTSVFSHFTWDHHEKFLVNICEPADASLNLVWPT